MREKLKTKYPSRPHAMHHRLRSRPGRWHIGWNSFRVPRLPTNTLMSVSFRLSLEDRARIPSGVVIARGRDMPIPCLLWRRSWWCSWHHAFSLTLLMQCRSRWCFLHRRRLFLTAEIITQGARESATNTRNVKRRTKDLQKRCRHLCATGEACIPSLSNASD